MIRDEPEVATIDVDRARRALVEAEARAAQTVSHVENRLTAAWDELVELGVAWKSERRLRGFLTGPAGKTFCQRHSLLAEEVIEEYRARRGSLEVDGGRAR